MTYSDDIFDNADNSPWKRFPASPPSPPIPDPESQPVGRSPLPETVPLPVLADLIGVTVRQTNELAKEGKIVRQARGEYLLRDSVRLYCEKLRTRGAKGALADEKLRVEKERADQLALKNAQTRQELLPAAQVEQEWAGICRDIRAGCLAITTRVQQKLPHLTTHDAEIIDSEIRNALQNLGNDHA